MSVPANPFEPDVLRLRLLLVGMMIAFVLLGLKLWHLQVQHGPRFQINETRQSVRRVRLPGIRGRIFDRNGNCMVDNRPSFNVAIYLEEMRKPGKWSNTIHNVEGVIDSLSETLDLKQELDRDEIWNHIRKRLPLPLMAWRDVDAETLARWAEQASNQQGVDLYAEAVRVFPYGRTACHVLGYVGRATMDDKGVRYHYYLPDMEGKQGIEKVFEDVLRGEAGGRLLRVDVTGYRYDDLGYRAPQAGGDIQLTLDLRIQQIAERILGDEPGSIVVLSPKTGDVLALASAPGYDPNDFVPVLTQAKWNALLADEDRPLINRTIAGTYAPGSTFKPVVALAAITSGLATPRTTFHCPGHFTLGRRTSHCWYKRGHGTIDMEESLQYSCNVYYWRLGLQVGYENIYETAKALGLGAHSGIRLGGEYRGLLPNNDWMRKKHNVSWQDGDTANVSIGQGPLLVTPLQMAVLTAAIANKGRVLQPRIVQAVREPNATEYTTQPSVVQHTIPWPKAGLVAVRNGMQRVIMSPRGTGKYAKVVGLSFAGKTGTAEFGIKGSGHKHAWMIGFAPYDDPEYAIVILRDEGVSGGVTTAPMMKKLVAGIFNISTTVESDS